MTQTTKMDIASAWEKVEYKDVSSYTTSPVPVVWQEAFHAVFRRLVLTRIGRWLGGTRPRKVVDLACGTGEWTLGFLPLADFVVGVDVNPSFVEKARRAAQAERDGGRAEFLRMNLLDFDGYEGVDLVCLGACVQCLADAEVDRLFATLAARLPPDGRLYLRTTVASPIYGAYRGRRGFFYRPRADYERRFARLGWKVDDRFPSVAVPPAKAVEDFLKVPGPVATVLSSPLWGPIYGKHALLRQGEAYNWLIRTTQVH
ncbi:MAG: class I SAM-dependent methyltransferase [Deltaproteobacteria bacterium]|nr:class I SAM-dependent methyltransferase [Deltaproteobacteria bacterium]